MLKKLQLNFTSLIGLVLLVISVWAISHELRAYNYNDVLKAINNIPKSRLSLSIWLTVLGYIILAAYDILAFAYIRRLLHWSKIAFVGFTSAVFSNTIGFGILTGGAVRYRYYASWGVPTVDIAQVIAFENITFWLGILSVAGFMFVLNPLQIPPQLHVPFSDARPVGVLFLVLVLIYLSGSIFLKRPLVLRGHELRFPNFKTALIQVIVSSLDWLLATGVLYALLPANTPLSFLDFLGVYLLAMFAGVASNVPSGLGVFETIILLILSSQVSGATLFGSMLVYRVIYYLLPMVIAAGMLGVYEFKHRIRIG
jgi:glycosyltransferase 2 family protein